jgi:hypothetical protein
MPPYASILKKPILAAQSLDIGAFAFSLSRSFTEALKEILC